jgi:hypothetical protein
MESVVLMAMTLCLAPTMDCFNTSNMETKVTTSVVNVIYGIKKGLLAMCLCPMRARDGSAKPSTPLSLCRPANETHLEAMLLYVPGNRRGSRRMGICKVTVIQCQQARKQQQLQ